MPPRVAYVISARGMGGAERLLAALVAGGAQRGWSQVIVNPFAVPASRALADACAPADFRAHSVRGVAGLPRARRWLARELASVQPDLVHVSLLHASVLAASVRRRPDAAWLLTHVYGDAVERRRDTVLTKRLDRWATRRFSTVVAISESVRRFLEAEHGIATGSIELIAPGWEGEPRPPPAGERPPTVVCVAKFRPEKGHSVLLEAFAAARQEMPSARLVLVGDGPLEGKIRARVRERHLEEAVEFAGAVAEIWPVLARADVFAMASVAEAAGIAIMEAMAAGLPVVAPAVGGIPELVVPGRNGELVRPGDADDMARALVKVLGDRELRARMGAAAREDAQPRRMEATVDRYFELYDRLLAQRPAPPRR